VLIHSVDRRCLLRYLIALALFALLLTRSRDGAPIPLLEGFRLAPAAEGGLLVGGSAPSFSVLFAWALLRERPSGRALPGSAVACAGILAILSATGGFGGASPQHRLGDVLGLAVLGPIALQIGSVQGGTTAHQPEERMSASNSL
jgi:drug/metabolite transporter (DMT)-like permease